MATTTTLANFLFKLRYGKLDDGALMAGNPLSSWAGHEKDFTTHKGIEIPSPTNTPQGFGGTNAAAAANTSSPEGQSFTVPQRSLYLRGGIDGIVVRNAQEGGDMTQFRNAFTRETDLAFEAMGSEVNQRMYGLNRGDRSIIKAGSAVNTTTLTLDKKTDAQFYEKNMYLHFLNPSTGALRTGGTGYVQIDKVNPQSGTLTLTGTLDTEVTSVAAGDIIVRKDMRNLDLDGLQGWAPATPGSFLGVDQTEYPGRACGLYLSLANGGTTGKGLMYALRYGESFIGKRFGKDTPIFINPMNLHAVEVDVEQARIMSTTMQGTYGIGIEVTEIFGRKFVSDPTCPRDKAFFVGKGAFTRGTCGMQPRLDNIDGQQFRYDTDTGELKFVLVHDGNCYSYAPYDIMQVALPAAPEF